MSASTPVVISPAAFAEIESALERAGFDHLILLDEEGQPKLPLCTVCGIAFLKAGPAPSLVEQMEAQGFQVTT